MAVGDIAEALQETEIEFGVGIIGSLVESGRAEYINDTNADPRGIQISGTDKAENERLMVAPLLAGSKVKGVMAVWRTGGVPFSDSDLDFLVGLSLQATVAIENARLFAESEKRATELATINTVSQQLGSKLELAPLLDLVGEQVRTVFNADVAYVALYNPDTGIIDFPYQFGDDLTPIKFGEGLTSRIIHSNKALIINHEADRRGLELGAKVVGKQALSYLGVPIPVGGACLGVISVQSTKKEGVYGADDQRLLSTIAANVGVALQNARLFNETQEALSHQTASADILRVISSSPTDVQPVFDAIVGTSSSWSAGCTQTPFATTAKTYTWSPPARTTRKCSRCCKRPIRGVRTGRKCRAARSWIRRSSAWETRSPTRSMTSDIQSPADGAGCSECPCCVMGAHSGPSSSPGPHRARSLPCRWTCCRLSLPRP